MEHLIEIEQDAIGGDLVQTVNARELHAFLGVGRRFGTWILERIAEYKFVENQDFVIFSPNREKIGKGRPSIEYHLTLDMAKELSMVERTDKGRQARRYFIECERIALGRIDALNSGDDELSTVRDRAPLLHEAIELMLSLHISIPNLYRAFNQYAGVRRFPAMTKRQAVDTTGFAGRVLKGEATQRDFERIERNRAALHGEEAQLQLVGVTVSLPGKSKKGAK